jgi:hypothetical protein
MRRFRSTVLSFLFFLVVFAAGLPPGKVARAYLPPPQPTPSIRDGDGDDEGNTWAPLPPHRVSCLRETEGVSASGGAIRTPAPDPRAGASGADPAACTDSIPGRWVSLLNWIRFRLLRF